MFLHRHKFRVAVRNGYEASINNGTRTVWHPVMVRYCERCNYWDKLNP